MSNLSLNLMLPGFRTLLTTNKCDKEEADNILKF